MRRLLSLLKPRAPAAGRAPDGASGEARVAFLVAGVQKGGTTTLARHLADHPDIGLARRKEVHFFDDEKRDWAAPVAPDYHRAFRFQGGRLQGECTPAYVYWDPAHDRIRAYNPAMRFVLVFRDPIERAFSHWSMEFARGNDDRPFAEAIRAGRRRVKAERWNKARRVFSYVERGFYGYQAGRLLERFPREQLLCLPSERLFAEPDAALADIARFLGLPPFPAAAREIHAKKAPAVDYPSRLTRADAEHLAGLFADDVARFARITGFDTSRWLDVAKYPD